MTRTARNELLDMHGFVLEQLTCRKGTWREIEAKTSVPYFTLAKIASGKTADPRISTVQKLANFFVSNPHTTSEAA